MGCPLLLLAVLGLLASHVHSEVLMRCHSKISDLSFIPCSLTTNKKVNIVIISNRCLPIFGNNWRYSTWQSGVTVKVKRGCKINIETAGGVQLPIPASWGEWKSRGACEVNCMQKRTRTCSSGNNEDCEGKHEESRPCQGGSCTTKAVWKNHKDCGKSQNNGFRVVGGSTASECQFPWMAVVINRNQNTQCGGSILDQWHILTAAHCVADDNNVVPSGRFFEVYTGSSKFEVKHTVEKAVSHDDYIYTNIIMDDVAVLKLKNPIQLNKCNTPVCLPDPSQKVQDQAHCRVSGWGLTSNFRGRTAKTLQWTEETAVTNAKCRQTYSSDQVNEKVFCAKGRNSGSCSGDSGGPLVCVGQGQDVRYYQFGIVSGGVSGQCGNLLGVYADVTYFLPWIINAVNTA